MQFDVLRKGSAYPHVERWFMHLTAAHRQLAEVGLVFAHLILE